MLHTGTWPGKAAQMAKYQSKAMEELSAELAAGPARLRRGYIDTAEELTEIIEPAQQYPYEFVVYRLTGYRPRRSEPTSEAILGKVICHDLLRMMLDLCDSMRLSTSDYDQTIYDSDTLARHFDVSTKTIQRWRRKGLPARRLIFPDGRGRIAFLEESVQRFVGRNRRRVRQSAKFTKLSDEERGDLIRRAKRMADFTQCTLAEVARRLSIRSGRAIETIRYTVRNHDRRHPEQAVFPEMTEPLSDTEKDVIYRAFLNGVSPSVLARKFSRTRGTIYRVVYERRATQLLHREIDYVYNPQFDLPNADEVILEGEFVGSDGKPAPADEDEEAEPRKKPVRVPSDLPPYLKALYRVPLLKAEEERELFRRYNYLKYKADRRREKIDAGRARVADLQRVESLLVQANLVKNAIIRANLRLVVSIAKKHLGGPQTLFELVSDGNVALMRAVEKFDYARGFRFSTYASWAIMRTYARSVPKERYQLDRFSTGNEQVLDIAASLRTYDPNDMNLPEIRESIDAMLSRLSARERLILADHYGLVEGADAKTFEQLGDELGISKERVRQIELQALKKLRRLSHPEAADLLS